MKKTRYFLLFILLVFMTINVNAATNDVNTAVKIQLIGDNKIEYGDLITYQLKIVTENPIEGFQFDLDYDSALTLVAVQSSNPNLKVKLSDAKDRVIGYGKTINNNEVVATIIFQTDKFNKTTNVSFKISNGIYTLDDLTTKKNNEVIETTTKVIVPEVEVVKTSTSPKVSTPEEKIKDPVIQKSDKENETIKEDGVTKVIKIIIIILLGAFILYLLNKEEKIDEETIIDESEKEKKIEKKQTKKTKK